MRNTLTSRAPSMSEEQMGASCFMMAKEADPMATSKALAKWVVARAVGKGLGLEMQESCPSLSTSAASKATVETVSTTATGASLLTEACLARVPHVPRPEARSKKARPAPPHPALGRMQPQRTPRIFTPVLRERASEVKTEHPESPAVPRRPAVQRPERSESRFPEGSTEATVEQALQHVAPKYREPLLVELLSMSQELRTARELAVAQSQRNSQLQREVEDQVCLFNTLVDLQQQNQWFEERRRHVDDANQVAMEIEQQQLESLRMAAEDVTASRLRLEEPNEIKKVLAASEQEMAERTQALEEELKELDDLIEEVENTSLEN
ncbi:Putative transporter [Durusdinium trenchii]|uniref:Transporter n=1 Tax=Durusdinium trenchii TaxID=1381693 RepID=A0ABP0HNP3_9DINO